MTGSQPPFTDGDYRLIEKELRDWGYGTLLCSPIMLIPLVLLVRSHGASIVPALLVGGMAGLALPLWKVGRPVWAGHIYAKYPG